MRGAATRRLLGLPLWVTVVLAVLFLAVLLIAPASADARWNEFWLEDEDGNRIESGSEIDIETLQRGLRLAFVYPSGPSMGDAASFYVRDADGNNYVDYSKTSTEQSWKGAEGDPDEPDTVTFWFHYAFKALPKGDYTVAFVYTPDRSQPSVKETYEFHLTVSGSEDEGDEGDSDGGGGGDDDTGDPISDDGDDGIPVDDNSDSDTDGTSSNPNDDKSDAAMGDADKSDTSADDDSGRDVEPSDSEGGVEDIRPVDDGSTPAEEADIDSASEADVADADKADASEESDRLSRAYEVDPGALAASALDVKVSGAPWLWVLVYFLVSMCLPAGAIIGFGMRRRDRKEKTRFDYEIAS